MKCHLFEVKDAEKHGVPKAILLYHLKYHMDSNQGNERYQHGGKVWAFAKLESLEQMYPYFSKSSISRWLRELEENQIIKSRKPRKNQGKHLKYYTVSGYSPGISQFRKSLDSSETGKNGKKVSYTASEANSQSGKSNSQTEKSARDNKEEPFSQNGKSSIVNNNKLNKGESAPAREADKPSVFSRVENAETVDGLYEIWEEYRRQKNRHPTLFEQDATKHQLTEWGLEKSRLIVFEAIRNGWISLKEDYLPDGADQEFDATGRPNAGAYQEYQEPEDWDE